MCERRAVGGPRWRSATLPSFASGASRAWLSIIRSARLGDEVGHPPAACRVRARRRNRCWPRTSGARRRDGGRADAGGGALSTGPRPPARPAAVHVLRLGTLGTDGDDEGWLLSSANGAKPASGLKLRIGRERGDDACARASSSVAVRRCSATARALMVALVLGRSRRYDRPAEPGARSAPTRTRATTSMMLPAAKGTTTRTGRRGGSPAPGRGWRGKRGEQRVRRCMAGSPASGDAGTSAALRRADARLTRRAARPANAGTRHVLLACGSSPPPYRPSRPAARCSRPPTRWRARRLAMLRDRRECDGCRDRRRARAVVVEPHASGLGGGGVRLAWDQGRGRVGLSRGRLQRTCCCRRRAAGAAGAGHAGRLRHRRGGRAAVVPGSVPMLGLAHAKAGALPWVGLVRLGDPRGGGRLSAAARDHTVLSRSPAAYAAVPALRAPYFGAAARAASRRHPDPQPEQAKALVRSPRVVLWRGPRAAGRGDRRRGRRLALSRHADARRPGGVPGEGTRAGRWRGLRSADLHRGAVGLGRHRGAGTARPLERLGYAQAAPGSAAEAHLPLQASRLVTADRRRWGADPDQVEVPAAGLLDPATSTRAPRWWHPTMPWRPPRRRPAAPAWRAAAGS